MELVEELRKSSHNSGDTESLLLDLTRDRLQVSLIEEKVREVLSMLRSLSTLNISEAVLGGLVLEAVEKAYDPEVGEVQVFLFLTLLYQSTREHERTTAETSLSKALEAVVGDVGESDDSSSSVGIIVPERMHTLRPRRPQARIGTQKEDVFRIDV